MNRILAAAVLVLAAACSKSSSSGSAPAPADAAAVPAIRGAKELLADPKVVAGFAAYQKDMAPHAKTAIQVFAAAYAKAGGDQKKLEQAAKDDPRIAEYTKANQAALAKAGISEHEMRTVSQALSDYLGTVAVAQGASDAAAQIKEAEDKLVGQYGAAALESVKKSQADLLAAQEATMKAVLSK